MKVSLKTSVVAFALSSVLGAAAPAFADSYYQGIDPNNPPGTQNQVRAPVMQSRGAPATVDEMPTGSIDNGRVIYPNSGSSYQPRYNGGDGDYYRGIVPPTP
ncbi:MULTISPECIES: hypothetical protein [unclassified Sinorhizobium]|uniref:hypothetical protein n=1 Tax=unclassified Sinorhizobium TaxID=2613772 RepID=UPI0024C3006D|nr:MULTISPECIES: hypothetical protein [unclassified Sinorhizobium]MDK1378316.1 hypothetical protein [Sinorhizobium sp. 6-70]MDK1480274.1 hypothetical protein [Sinorhizobium sp. 6-117]